MGALLHRSAGPELTPDPSIGAGQPAVDVLIPEPSQVRPSATSVVRVAVIMARRVSTEVVRLVAGSVMTRSSQQRLGRLRVGSR
jgi:hypothetical protein